MTDAYFERLSANRFVASQHTGGVWNPAELHISPLLGVMAHEANKLQSTLTLGSFHCDILGTIPIGEVEVHARVVRPGTTIELVEIIAETVRPVALARAWFLATPDTSRFADLQAYGSIPPRTEATARERRFGSFLASIDIRHRVGAHGHNHAWMRPDLPLIAGEEVSPTAAMIAVIDMANGVNTIGDPLEVAYPNVELSANFLRPPRGEWTGFSTRTGFSDVGLGLNSTTLFDDDGPVGTVTQTLTLRPR